MRVVLRFSTHLPIYSRIRLLFWGEDKEIVDQLKEKKSKGGESISFNPPMLREPQRPTPPPERGPPALVVMEPQRPLPHPDSQPNLEERAVSFRERLAAFYTVYNPACLNSLDMILSTYSGREQDLMRILVSKYGPEPAVDRHAMSTTKQAPTSEIRKELTGEPSTAKPQERAELAENEAMPVNNVSSAVSSAIPSSFRERLIRFYEAHNPQNIERVDNILCTYARTDKEREQFMETLVQKYGPEPPVYTVVGGPQVHRP